MMREQPPALGTGDPSTLPHGFLMMIQVQKHPPKTREPALQTSRRFLQTASVGCLAGSRDDSRVTRPTCRDNLGQSSELGEGRQVEASSLLIKPLPLLLVKVDHFLQRLDFLGGQIGPFPPFNKEGHQRIATNQGNTPKPFRPYNAQTFDEEPKSLSQMSCGWCSDL